MERGVGRELKRWRGGWGGGRPRVLLLPLSVLLAADPARVAQSLRAHYPPPPVFILHGINMCILLCIGNAPCMYRMYCFVLVVGDPLSRNRSV